MPVKVGNTAITTVGKVKLGTTNITKIFRGTTQIWPVQVFSFDFSSAFANGILACNASSVSTSITLYSATANLIVGTVFYTDSTLTTVFPGNNNFYLGTNASQSIYRKHYQINNLGQILQFNSCSG